MRAVKALYGHEGRIASLAVSPGGGLLLSASQDRSVRLWRVDDGRELRRFGPLADEAYSACFVGGQDKIAFAVAPPFWREAPDPDWAPVEIHSLADGAGRVVSDLGGLATICLLPLPGGRRILAAVRDEAHSSFGVAEIGVQSGTVVRRFGADVFVKSMALCKRGLATSDHDARVIIWDFERGERTVARSFGERAKWVGGIAVSPDGAVIALAGPMPRLLSAGDLADIGGLPPRKRGEIGPPANAVAFAAPDNVLAIGTGHPVMPGDYHEDCGVTLVDTAGGKIVGRVETEAPVTALAFIAGAALLAAGDGDGGILILEA